jgi:membrane associated rhomboid family serine protease
VVSYTAFGNPALRDRLIFYPWLMDENRQWYRFITSGFIHGDMMHLLFNMLTLFFFGPFVEQHLDMYGGAFPLFKYLILYMGSMALAGMFTFFKQRQNPNYMALGASGAVSGVLFSAIVFDPWMTLLMFGIIPIPGILFGLGYLYYSARMAKQGADNIGHDAHFFGAVAGVVFTLLFNPPTIWPIFLENLLNPRFGF